MNLHSLNMILAQASNTAAPGTNAPPATQMQEDQRALLIKNLAPIVIIIFVGYMLILRPQRKRDKERADQLKTIKPGDKVVTGSGIVGTVVAIKDKTISLRSAETKLEVLKSAITDITKSDGETAESQPPKS